MSSGTEECGDDRFPKSNSEDGPRAMVIPGRGSGIHHSHHARPLGQSQSQPLGCSPTTASLSPFQAPS